MTSVTFPTALGGDGSTVSDDADPTTGLRNAGYKTRFVPALQQTVNMTQTTVNKAAAAAASEAVAVTKAAEARASELAAAGYANEAMLLSLDVETLRPSIKPSLLLDFERSQSLAPSVSLLRASVAIAISSSGALSSFGINVPRIEFNPSDRSCEGFLVEDTRTNLLTYSDDLTNGAWSKAGLTATSAILVTEDVALANHVVSRTFAYTPATYTMSFTIKAGANLALGRLVRFRPNNNGSVGGVNTYSAIDPRTGVVSVTANGATIVVKSAGPNRWRVSLTFTATGSANGSFAIGLWDGISAIAGSYTGDGVSDLEITEIDLEVGAFALSHIQTVAATATRATDNASNINLSQWYRQDKGTFYIDFEPLSPITNSGTQTLLDVGDTTSDNRLRLFRNATTGRVSFSSTSGGLTLPSSLGNVLGNAGIEINQTCKVAIAMASNDFALAVNGTIVESTSSGALPLSPTILYIGRQSNGLAGYANARFKSIKYFPDRITNAQIAAMTTL